MFWLMFWDNLVFHSEHPNKYWIAGGLAKEIPMWQWERFYNF